MEALKTKDQSTKRNKDSNDKKTSERGPIKFFTVKLRGLGYNHKKKDIKLFFRPLKAKSIRVPPKIKGIAYVGFKTEQHLKKALLKDKSFLGINTTVDTKEKLLFGISTILYSYLHFHRWETNIRNEIRSEGRKI